MPSTEIVSKWTRHSPCPLARNLGTKIESHKVEEVLGSFYHPTCIFSSIQLYVDNGCKGDWCWAWNIVGIREIADESESGKGSQGRLGSQGSREGDLAQVALGGRLLGPCACLWLSPSPFSVSPRSQPFWCLEPSPWVIHKRSSSCLARKSKFTSQYPFCSSLSSSSGDTFEDP